MDQKLGSTPAAGAARSTQDAAQDAASARALAARVTELEALLAVERAENARRLQEVDGHMRVMRTALQDLQADYRRSSSEREKLYMELDEREQHIIQMQEAMAELREKADQAATDREGAAAEVVAASIARAQRAEQRLARSEALIEELRAEITTLEENGPLDGATSTSGRLSRLEDDMARRDQELIRAAELIHDYEERLRESNERAKRIEQDNQQLRTRMDRLLKQFETVVFQAVTPDDPTSVAHDPPEVEGDTYLTSATEEGGPVPEVVAGRVKPAKRAIEGADDDTFIPIDDEIDAPEEPRARRAVWAPGEEPPAPPPVVSGEGGEGGEGAAPKEQTAPKPRKSPEPSAPATPEADVAGLRIEGLRIEQEERRDAYGVVHLAREIASRRPVQVRVLATGDDGVEAHRVEKLLLVRHRNVVSTLAFSNSAAGAYIVKDRPSGERADQWLTRVGPLSERIAVAVALQIAKGLREAAFQGVVHGALSPETLYVDATGDVRVDDVGVAGLGGPASAPDGPFVAPERAAGADPEARSDVFSLGVLLAFLVTGEVPEAGADLDPRATHAEVSPELARLVGRLTARDPDARPVTWDEVVVALDRRVAGEPEPEPSRAARALQLARSYPHVVVGIVASVALVIAAAYHLSSAPELTEQQSFDRAVVAAETLLERGDVDGARDIYLRFLRTTGDAVVRRDAARRLDALRDR